MKSARSRLVLLVTAAAVALVAIAGGLVLVLGNDGPEEVAIDYFNAVIEHDCDRLTELLADENDLPQVDPLPGSRRGGCSEVESKPEGPEDLEAETKIAGPTAQVLLTYGVPGAGAICAEEELSFEECEYLTDKAANNQTLVELREYEGRWLVVGFGSPDDD